MNMHFNGDKNKI